MDLGVGMLESRHGGLLVLGYCAGL